MLHVRAEEAAYLSSRISPSSSAANVWRPLTRGVEAFKQDEVLAGLAAFAVPSGTAGRFLPVSMNLPVQPMLLCFSYADRSHADDAKSEGKVRVLCGENRLALLRNRDEIACAGYPLRHALQAKAINCCPISSLSLFVAGSSNGGVSFGLTSIPCPWPRRGDHAIQSRWHTRIGACALSGRSQRRHDVVRPRRRGDQSRTHRRRGDPQQPTNRARPERLFHRLQPRQEIDLPRYAHR